MSKFPFHLPDIGEGLQEAEIVDWLVSLNDHVVEDQPLLSIETDKALVDIPSPVSGKLMAIYVKVGEVVAIGTLIAEFETESRVDSGAIVGRLQKTTAVQEEKQTHSIGESRLAGEPQKQSSITRASPAVRAQARRLGIDLATVKGTGKDNTISVADLQRSNQGGVSVEALSGPRRQMFTRMSKAHQQVVRATVTGFADIDSWAKDQVLLLRLIQALVAACQAEPALNCWFDSEQQQRTFHSDVNLGIAVDSKEGLFVPTLVKANQQTAEQLEQSIELLLTAVAERSITATQMQEQTITLSNFGSIGGIHAEMVVAPPQVAIVGAGSITPTPVAFENNVEIHALLPLSLTFDHRVVNGGEATRFLNTLIQSLQSPTLGEDNE